MEMDGNEIRRRSLQRPGNTGVGGKRGKKRNFGRIGSGGGVSETVSVIERYVFHPHPLFVYTYIHAKARMRIKE